MVEALSLDEAVKNAVEKYLPRNSVVRVELSDTIDSADEAAIAVKIILQDDVGLKISGEQGIRANSAIYSVLEEAGEERPPIIRYSTEAEEALPEEPGPDGQ